MYRVPTISALLLVISMCGCESPRDTAALGVLLRTGAIGETNPQRALALAVAGQTARDFAIAEAGRPVRHSGSGRRHYDGRLRDGSHYSGQIEDRLPHGDGTMRKPDGTMVQGDWVQGRLQGTATITLITGTELQGQFASGNFISGRASWVNEDGSTFEGEMKGQPLRMIRGTLTQPNGSRYDGEFEQGRFHGTGTFTSAEGYRYVGEWQHGEPHGIGTAYFPDGNFERGEWRSGRFVASHTAGGVSDSEVATGSGVVKVIALPDHADIYVNDSFVGNAPANLTLASGVYIIEVKRSGHRPFRRELRVLAGSEITLRAELERED